MLVSHKKKANQTLAISLALDVIRDLAILANQMPISEQHNDLPTWADWSWRESYLPEDIHTSYATLVASLNKLQTCPISGSPSAMESKWVIEYEEDEADSNMPTYLIPFLIYSSWLLLVSERLTKERLDKKEEMMMALDDEGVMKSVPEEREEEQEEEADEVMQKGRKRGGTHYASSSECRMTVGQFASFYMLASFAPTLV
ncbi:hypothetical protein BDR04DRAFT_1123804, partial [Suillus decipiens]